MRKFDLLMRKCNFSFHFSSHLKTHIMKKLFLSLWVTCGLLVVNAQTDSLQQYTGKFKFPEGSPVIEITVVLEDGILNANSAIGNSELRKTDTRDVFDIVAYSGTATFSRTDEGKIKTMRVQVQDIDMEGVKEPGGSVQYFPHRGLSYLLSDRY